MKYDYIIIGQGPAGISSALQVLRAGMSVLIIGRDAGALRKAERIENYYGLAQAISGDELAEIGVRQAKSLGAEMLSAEVVDAAYAPSGGFEIRVADSDIVYECTALLIATGTSRKTVNLEGISEYEGKGVSYCAVCDAFFHKGKHVAVLGGGAYAEHEAEVLANVCSLVTLIAPQPDVAPDATPDAAPDTTPNAAPEATPEATPDAAPEVVGNIEKTTDNLARVSGENGVLRYLHMTSGRIIEVSGLFIALGTAGAADIARKLGVQADDKGRITVDADMKTAIPGVFAAGDCTGGILQVSEAAAEGLKAGLSAVKYIRSQRR